MIRPKPKGHHHGGGSKGGGGRPPIHGGPGDGRPVPPGFKPPNPGFGELLIVAPDFYLYARQGTGTPTPSLPSGWSTVAREDDVAITQFGGRDPRRESVTLMLDRFAIQNEVWGGDEDVELQIAQLESLLEPDGKDHLPPIFRVRGGIHLSNRRVVLESLEFGDVQIRDAPSDRRVRQDVTLGLLEYVRADQLKIKRVKRKDPSTYVVKGNDATLRSIAVKLRPHASPKGQADYARAIGKLNKIRDIRKKLKPGTKLKLPK